MLRGHAAAAMDTALQRLKALDLIAGQLPWNIAQRVELAPREGVALASKMEAVEAARENKAEMQAYSGRFGDGIQGRQGRFESSTRQGPLEMCVLDYRLKLAHAPGTSEPPTSWRILFFREVRFDVLEILFLMVNMFLILGFDLILPCLKDF